MANDQLVDVSITSSSADWLADFVRGLVRDRLAACGNIITGVRSIYTWGNEIQDDAEFLAIIHTRRSRVAEIITRADEEHPDETPQVIVTEAIEVHPGYLQWVLDSTT